MSLLDVFGSDAACPLCGSAGAKKLLFLVRCPNRGCPNSPDFSSVQAIQSFSSAKMEGPRPPPGDDVCPLCGAAGVKKFPTKGFTGFKCPNPSCKNVSGGMLFDDGHWMHLPESGRAPAKSKAAKQRPPFDASAAPLRIRYRNFRGEEKTFEADGRSLRAAGVHVSVRVAPNNGRIALAKGRILNLADVEELLRRNPMPSANERRILSYHKRKGTTSPNYEKLRQKYPDWRL